jgi:hypothetical protein
VSAILLYLFFCGLAGLGGGLLVHLGLAVYLLYLLFLALVASRAVAWICLTLWEM